MHFLNHPGHAEKKRKKNLKEKLKKIIHQGEDRQLSKAQSTREASMDH